MERPIYHVVMEPEEEQILEEMRKHCAKEFGVTLTGNRLTLRWYRGGKLVHVHMIIEHVDDGTDKIETDHHA